MPKAKEATVPLMDVRNEFIDGFNRSCNAASQLSVLVESILEINHQGREIPDIAWQQLQESNEAFRTAYWGE